MDPKATFKTRTYIVCGVFSFLLLVVIGKLFFLQVVHGKRYAMEADHQYVSQQSKETKERGSILFVKRDGTRISGATMETGFTIAVNPSKIGERDVCAELLPLIQNFDTEECKKRVAKKSDPYEELATKVPKESADAALALKVPTLQAIRNNWRVYPGATLAAHLLGYAGENSKGYRGQYGLERSYDETLRRSSEQLFVNFFAEVFSRLKNFVDRPASAEGDLVTTIEPSVQLELEEQLAAAREKWNSDRIAGLIMDPKTGAIVAMAVSPTFDPNQYNKVDSVSVFANPLVDHVFEVGSIMKPLIMAAGIQEGVVTPDTTYYDKGEVTVKDRTFHNFDGKGRGQVNMQTVLDQSLNTGMVFVESKIPHPTLRKYLEGYGLGTKSGIDLPGEVSGLTKNLETGGDVEYATISFGQGIAVTPIAMVRALSSLAMDGVRPDPYVVKSIDYIDGNEWEHEETAGTRVLNHETAEIMTSMLVHVFDNYGDGKYRIPHYSIAGKTGTAQIANTQTGGYYKDRNLHSFFGYFPAYEPRFIVYLFNEYPKNGAEFASQTLIEPFTKIANFLIGYYDIPPDR